MNILRKITSLATAAVLLFALTSCTVEMRDTYDPTDVGKVSDQSDAPSLTEAEKVNSVDTDPNSGVSPGTVLPTDTFIEPTDTDLSVTLALSGDIKLTQSIIEDAHAQAPEGKDYAFLRIYSSVYRMINDADIAVGGYSMIGKPAGDESDAESPIEHLDALAALGYDILDTSGVGSDYSLLNEYSVGGISHDEEGDNAFRSIEKNGMIFTFVAVGGDGAAQSYNDEKFYQNLEYADLPSDLLIVLVHWDDDISADDAASVAARLANSGADVIVGYGDSLGKAERIENEKGEEALVFYSLGNLLSDADEGYALVSGVLSLTFDPSSDGSKLSAAIVPTVVHYSAERGDFAIYRLEEYTDDLAQSHGAKVDTESLNTFCVSKISEEFLPGSVTP